MEVFPRMLQIIKLITVCSSFFVSACMSKYRSDNQIFVANIPEGMTAIEVMQIFGARGEESFTTQEISGMSRPFKYSDLNSDGYLTEDEYVGASKHFRKNSRGARGFLRASDNNRDGKVSHEEYIQNRIITDEAKDIYRKIIPETDWESIPVFRWSNEQDAFLSSPYFHERAKLNEIFIAMDRDADGHLSLPEYLMIYGKWARQALPEEIIDGDKTF